jgi:death-on-curing protein
MLQHNDYYLDRSVSDQDVYDLALSVTSDAFPTPNHGLPADEVIQCLADWLRKKSDRVNPRVSSMTRDDFVSRCEEAGARTRATKGGSILIQNGLDSIKIARSTQRLDGQAILKYLSTLKLGHSAIGLSPQEFQEGASSERQQIYRFIVALRRLART